MNIREFIKKEGRRYKYELMNCIYYFNAFPRYLGFNSAKYNSIRKYKGKYTGKRCFIVATGPSLTSEDLELLKDEYTFGVNSICKYQGWKPTFFGIQDLNVYNKLKDVLNDYTVEHAFYGSTLRGLIKNERWNCYCLNSYYHEHTFVYQYNFFAKFSMNPYAQVFDGYSITYSMLQLAVYMGFKEIYLVGCDCNYSADPTQQHFIESGHFDHTFATAGYRMIKAFEAANKKLKKTDIKIYNATRGGMLEVFPRVNLTELFI